MATSSLVFFFLLLFYHSSPHNTQTIFACSFFFFIFHSFIITFFLSSGRVWRTRWARGTEYRAAIALAELILLQFKNVQIELILVSRGSEKETGAPVVFFLLLFCYSEMGEEGHAEEELLLLFVIFALLGDSLAWCVRASPRLVRFGSFGWMGHMSNSSLWKPSARSICLFALHNNSIYI